MKLRNNRSYVKISPEEELCPITLESINELYSKNYKEIVKMSDNKFYSKKALIKWKEELENQGKPFILPTRKEFTDEDIKKLSNRKRKRNEENCYCITCINLRYNLNIIDYILHIQIQDNNFII